MTQPSTLHRQHSPRIRVGAVDVVPFVPLGSADLEVAVGARDRFAEWAGRALGLPCFLYGRLPGGASRTLPEVRRDAFAKALYAEGYDVEVPGVPRRDARPWR